MGRRFFKGVLKRVAEHGVFRRISKGSIRFSRILLFANQNYLTAGFPLPILPFVLPVAKNFQFGYAQQANLTIERQIAGSWTISVGYQYTRGAAFVSAGVMSTRAIPQLLTQNLQNADAAGLGFNESGDGRRAGSECGADGDDLRSGRCCAERASENCLGVRDQRRHWTGSLWGRQRFSTFFRPSGPNPSFARQVPGGYATQVQLAEVGWISGEDMGCQCRLTAVDAQLSDGSSIYQRADGECAEEVWALVRITVELYVFAYDRRLDGLAVTTEPQDSRFPFTSAEIRISISGTGGNERGDHVGERMAATRCGSISWRISRWRRLSSFRRGGHIR